MRSPEYNFRRAVRSVLTMAMSASLDVGDSVEVIVAAAHTMRLEIDAQSDIARKQKEAQ